MAWEYADGTSIIKAHNFSATPMPADATTPRELTMAMITRNDTLTSKSCKAIGSPNTTIRPMIFLSNRMELLLNSNGSVFFRIIRTDIATLKA